MEIIARAAAAAVIGSILALLLKKYTPELSLLTALAAGVAVAWLSASVCGRVADVLREAAAAGGVSSLYVSPVMKCVGIGLVTNLASQVCRDAGQGTVASAVEVCGTVCALYVSLPLIESLLAVVGRLV